MSIARRKAGLNAIWRTINSLDESMNEGRLLFESEMHVLASLLDEFSGVLKSEDRISIAVRVLPMIDMEAVRSGSGEHDVGGEPHKDTFDYFTRALFASM